jgi:hypothetical protein
VVAAAAVPIFDLPAFAAQQQFAASNPLLGPGGMAAAQYQQQQQPAYGADEAGLGALPAAGYGAADAVPAAGYGGMSAGGYGAGATPAGFDGYAGEEEQPEESYGAQGGLVAQPAAYAGYAAEPAVEEEEEAQPAAGYGSGGGYAAGAEQPAMEAQEAQPASGYGSGGYAAEAVPAAANADSSVSGVSGASDAAASAAATAAASAAAATPPTMPAGTESFSSAAAAIGFINSYGDGTAYGTFALTLAAGDVLTMGTTSMAGAACVGETYLGLVGPDGGTVASNRNYGGGACSYLQYTVASAGSYSVQEGCVGETACSGVVAYAVASAPPAPPVATSGSCAPYASTSAQDGTVIGSSGLAPRYATCVVTLAVGDSISLGTTYLPGAVCVGSTFVGLTNPDGTLVSYSDNVGSDGADVCSFMQATATQAGAYIIEEGCPAGVSKGCSGVVAYTVTAAAS